MSRRMPRGVRKVNENIIQDGRSLIINEENEKNISWENIPDGSIKINSSNGMMYVKIKGESDWVPAGIKNDGTLSIAKDTFIIEEIFTIKTLSDGNGEFSYYNTEGEVRHGELLEDGSYVFTLEKGSYPMLRNHLEIIIDDALRRTAISGGIKEISNTKFAITEKLVVDQEITVRYLSSNRIGNPYPRIFLTSYTPEQAENGDLWLDYDATLDDDDLIGEDIEADTVIGWDRIVGKPTTINGYGIIDDISYVDHKHKMEDITDLSFPSTNKANGGNADTVNHYTVDNNNPNTLAILDLNGQIPSNKIASHKHNVSDINDLNNKISNIENSLNGIFARGMIIQWYGSASTPPSGWAICNGSNGTPDLRNKFIVGAGSSYNLGNAASVVSKQSGTVSNSTIYALYYIMKL